MGSEGTIQAICQQLTESLEAERCTIRVPHGKMLRLIAAYGIDAEGRQKEIPIKGTIAGYVAIGGNTIHIPDILKDSRYDQSYIESGDPKALLVIPLLFEGNLFGVAQIYRKEPFSFKQISLTDILAQFAALTLYHIETSKMSRRATLEVIEAIFESSSFEQIFMRVAEKISQRLDVPRCLFYRIFSENSELCCEIAAGVPLGEHKIGLKDPIGKHPDIEFAVNEKKIVVIDQPLSDERTEHFRGIVEDKKIRAILYVPLILKSQAIGVLVLDAAEEKENFSAEEKSFCGDIAWILARLIDRNETALKELEHIIINPLTSMGGYAQRLLGPLTRVYEIAENICQNAQQTCKGAEEIHRIASEILPKANRIKMEADKADIARKKIREINA